MENKGYYVGKPVSMPDTRPRQCGNAEVACTESIFFRESSIVEVGHHRMTSTNLQCIRENNVALNKKELPVILQTRVACFFIVLLHVSKTMSL